MLEILVHPGPSVLTPVGFEPAPSVSIKPETTPWLVVSDERARRRLLAPDGLDCVVSQARVLTVERLLSECMGFMAKAPQLPTAVEQFLLMGSITQAEKKTPNAGMIATMLEVERLGHEGVAPGWMQEIIVLFRNKLAAMGKCSHRDRHRLVLNELGSGPNSPLVRHLREMVGVIRIEGFDFIDGLLSELARALSEHVRLEIIVAQPPDKKDADLLTSHYSGNPLLSHAAICIMPSGFSSSAIMPGVVRLRQSFQQPLWVASRLIDILNVSDHFPSVAVVVPSSAHAEKVRLALELAGIPVSCPAESTMPLDTRPGQFFNRLLNFPAMPLLNDIDRIVSDPWARGSFKNFWLWPMLRRICDEHRTGMSPDCWADFFVSVLEKWAACDETGSKEDNQGGKHINIENEFNSNLISGEANRGQIAPQSEGEETADAIEPSRVTTRAERALQMAALAAGVVKFMRLAATAREKPTSDANGTRQLAERLGKLLDETQISRRLSGFCRGTLPAGAMETDQKAAAKIREALKGLYRADISSENLSLDQAINLALAAQRVRLSPRDSGCVQVLSPAMAAGEPFDYVFVLGLESGCYESSLPDPSLCPPVERGRLRNQLASHLKRICHQAQRAAWLIWSEADKEQKQVRGAFLDDIERTFGATRLAELVPDEVVMHRKPVDSFRVENARAWSDRLDRLSQAGATSANLPDRPGWLPRVMELAWPKARHFSPTRLQNHHKCRYMFFSSETAGCHGFDRDDNARLVGEYIHRIMELAVKKDLVFPPSRESILGASVEAWQEFHGVLAPEMRHFGTELADMLDNCKALKDVSWQATSGSTEESLKFAMNDADGVSFEMRLRMDALLRKTSAADSASIVLDYKRSMPNQVDRQVADGTLLEPLIYLEAGRQCKKIALDKLDMAFLQLKPKGSAKLAFVRENNNWLANPSGRPVPPVKELLDVVSRSVSEVRRGVYGLTVLDSEEHPSRPCSGYCQSRHVCRHRNQPVKLMRG